jgi:hypothetical protein
MKLEEVRPELQWFVRKMEARMAAKDKEKSGWKVEPISYFLDQIDTCSCKLSSRIIWNSGVLEKAADVANFAMMLAYVWMNQIPLDVRRSVEKYFTETTEDKNAERPDDAVLDRLNKLENAVDEYLKYCGPCETDDDGYGFYCDWEDCPYCNLHRIAREGR